MKNSDAKDKDGNTLVLDCLVQIDWFDEKAPCRFHGRIGRVVLIDKEGVEIDVPGEYKYPFFEFCRVRVCLPVTDEQMPERVVAK